MIFALEGPDRCGKSTLLEALRPLLPHARFVKLPSFKLSSADDLTRHNIAMWDAVHNPLEAYVCDRCSFVSSSVYMRVRGETPPDVERWIPHVRVVYLDVPRVVLIERHAATHDWVGMEDINIVQYGYDIELRRWHHARIDGTLPMNEIAEEVAAWINANASSS